MPKQCEQEINARYAQVEGIGDYTLIEHLTGTLVEQYFDHSAIRIRPGNGVDQVLHLLGIGNGTVHAQKRA